MNSFHLEYLARHISYHQISLFMRFHSDAFCINFTLRFRTTKHTPPHTHAHAKIIEIDDFSNRRFSLKGLFGRDAFAVAVLTNARPCEMDRVKGTETIRVFGGWVNSVFQMNVIKINTLKWIL